MAHRTHIALLVLALALWAPFAGSIALFLINGLGSSGAFTELPSAVALRSLRLAAEQGFRIGVLATPFLSLAPALIIFGARKFATKLSDTIAGAVGSVIIFAVFGVWITFNPLDPLLGGIIPVVFIVLLIAGIFTGFLVGSLRPRATPTTPAP